jgi:hypothetical protein
MMAFLVTLSMWVQGMPIKCDKVTRDKDGFYHLRYIDRKTKDTFDILSDQLIYRIDGCGL